MKLIPVLLANWGEGFSPIDAWCDVFILLIYVILPLLAIALVALVVRWVIRRMYP